MANGWENDGGRLLRESVSRPPSDVGEAVLTLIDEGRRREAHELLDACVRSRTAEDAARCAQGNPRRLVPLLTQAAEAVSGPCHWNLLHALRVAGLAH
jgi:hypothetical protein